MARGAGGGVAIGPGRGPLPRHPIEADTDLGPERDPLAPMTAGTEATRDIITALDLQKILRSEAGTPIPRLPADQDPPGTGITIITGGVKEEGGEEVGGIGMDVGEEDEEGGVVGEEGEEMERMFLLLICGWMGHGRRLR